MRGKRKVYAGNRKRGKNYVFFPMIRLSGRYLRENGFEIGDTINISVVHGIIFISKA